MDYAVVTNPGTRDHNEDSFLALENDAGSLFVVADGLGGHGSGEVASAIAAETFRKRFIYDPADAGAFLPGAFMAAQSNILEEQKAQSSPFDMKTTCVALLIAEGICRIGYIGDSRAYVFRNNRIKARTLDHSVPQMLAASGEIKERHIRSHPDRNLLLRVMGNEWDSPCFELLEEIPLSGCQAFLVCSDGFWELCDEKKMRTSLKKSRKAAQWLRLMTEEVEKKGLGRETDNFTAIAVVC